MNWFAVVILVVLIIGEMTHEVVLPTIRKTERN